MRRIVLLVTLVVVMATMMVAMAMPAFAAPQEPHGTCQVGGTGSGAQGCAGNVGGFIVNENAEEPLRCINNGPFNINRPPCAGEGPGSYSEVYQ
jgi:hypothetical protein